MAEGLTARQIVAEAEAGRLPGWGLRTTVGEEIASDSPIVHDLTLAIVKLEADTSDHPEERLRILEVTRREGRGDRLLEGHKAQPTNELIPEEVAALTHPFGLDNQPIHVPTRIITDSLGREFLPPEFDVVADLWGNATDISYVPGTHTALDMLVSSALARKMMGTDLEAVPRGKGFSASLATLLYGNEWIGNTRVDWSDIPQPVYRPKAVFGVIVCALEGAEELIVPEDGLTPAYRDVCEARIDDFRQNATGRWQNQAAQGRGLSEPASYTSVWDTTQLLSHLPDEYLERLEVDRPEPYQSWPI